MKIKLSRSQWEQMGKKAGWGDPIPRPQEMSPVSKRVVTTREIDMAIEVLNNVANENDQFYGVYQAVVKDLSKKSANIALKEKDIEDLS